MTDLVLMLITTGHDWVVVLYETAEFQSPLALLVIIVDKHSKSDVSRFLRLVPRGQWHMTKISP